MQQSPGIDILARGFTMRRDLIAVCLFLIAVSTAACTETSGSSSARLVEQITASVRWEESMRYLLSQGFTHFIELGPGTALSGFMKRIDKSAQVLNVSDAASLEATSSALAKPPV